MSYGRAGLSAGLGRAWHVVKERLGLACRDGSDALVKRLVEMG